MSVRALCVVIHDVAPATWPQCRRLLAALAAVAPVPTTLLVVPHYHGLAPAPAAAARCDAMLTALLTQGHELALHGWTHLDHGDPPAGMAARWLRTVYTTGEGEFAAIDAAQAGRLLRLGRDWFAQRGWPLGGFVAPAWLLGAGAWQALRQSQFDYTTTYGRLHLLRQGRSVWSPSLVYAARNRAGRLLSPGAVTALARALRPAGLVRLGLHPADADHPQLLRHAQHLLASLLQTRQALTKGEFVRHSMTAALGESGSASARRPPS